MAGWLAGWLKECRTGNGFVGFAKEEVKLLHINVGFWRTLMSVCSFSKKFPVTLESH